MSEAKHTPGPWKALWHEENVRLRLGSWAFFHDDTSVVPLRRCTRKNAKAEANARLLAAAPEMLAALTEAERVVVQGQRDGATFEEYADLLSVLRAAIAKASSNS